MTVFLVGAGPGDPTLLTLRASELLSKADVVIHDRLVDRRVLDLVRDGAIVIDAGKSPGAGADQKALNELLVEYSTTFSCVVRLKGGDPYIFGRGGEEAVALEEARCHYEVVPGVSSFSGAGAAAGIPLTMRGHSSGFVVITGHGADDDTEAVQDWKALAATDATIVVLMGVSNRAEIARRLIAAGKAESTPVGVIEQATTALQRTIRTTLDGLGAVDVKNPATIVIGSVASLAFASYEDRPLAGTRVVVTRDVHQSNELATLVDRLGGEAISVPTVSITEVSDGGEALRESLLHLSQFDWIVFSSTNAVHAVMDELHDARSFGSVRVAAIGTSTAALLRAHGIVADFVPSRFVSEQFVEDFPRRSSDDGGRVLLPRSQQGRDVIETGLAEKGWDVEVVEAYRTVAASLSPSALALIQRGDIITFASSSAVDGALSTMNPSDLPPIIATIGPITSRTVRAHGLEVAIEAAEHTIRGLIDAIVDHVEAAREEHPAGG